MYYLQRMRFIKLEATSLNTYTGTLHPDVNDASKYMSYNLLLSYTMVHFTK